MKTFKPHTAQGLGAIPVIILMFILSVIAAGFIVAFKIGWQSLSLNEMLHNPSEHEMTWSKYLNFSESIIQTDTLNPNDVNLMGSNLFQKIIPEGAQIVSVENNTINQSDAVTVIIRGNREGSRLNCEGMPIVYNKATQHKIFVNEHQQLVCQTSHTQSTHVMVENVEAMHLNLGVDLNGDYKVDRLHDPESLQGALSQVLSLRMSLLLKTNRFHENVLGKKFYNLQNEEIGPFEDNQLRKVYTTSIRVSSRGQS